MVEAVVEDNQFRLVEEVVRPLMERERALRDRNNDRERHFVRVNGRRYEMFFLGRGQIREEQEKYEERNSGIQAN